MPDGVKLSSLWFFTVDVSFKLIILSRETIFPDCQCTYLDITAQKGILQPVWGRASVVGVCPCKKPAGSLGMFFSNPALMCYSNSAEDASVIPLIYLEMNLQHIISSCESEILSEMRRQQKGTRSEKNPHVWFYNNKFDV